MVIVWMMFMLELYPIPRFLFVKLQKTTCNKIVDALGT